MTAGLRYTHRMALESALYHRKGRRRGAIYHDEADRFAWLAILASTCKRFNFVIHAYCQMTNHFHLMVETVDAGLHRGMRHLNSAYAQFNRRHGLVGHLFQGRYRAILCQKEIYLLELARYIVLNPVRAGMVAAPVDWRWSSYRHVISEAEKPSWLESDWILLQFGREREAAVSAFREFVAAGIGLASPLHSDFLTGYVEAENSANMVHVPRVQRKATAFPLEEYFKRFPDRREAIARAYETTAYSMAEIARHLNVSPRTVSRAIHRRHADFGDCSNDGLGERP